VATRRPGTEPRRPLPAPRLPYGCRESHLCRSGGFSYSWRSPPNRSYRRTSRCFSPAGSMIGSGSGRRPSHPARGVRRGRGAIPRCCTPGPGAGRASGSTGPCVAARPGGAGNAGARRRAIRSLCQRSTGLRLTEGRAPARQRCFTTSVSSSLCTRRYPRTDSPRPGAAPGYGSNGRCGADPDDGATTPPRGGGFAGHDASAAPYPGQQPDLLRPCVLRKVENREDAAGTGGLAASSLGEDRPMRAPREEHARTASKIHETERWDEAVAATGLLTATGTGIGDTVILHAGDQRLVLNSSGRCSTPATMA
jgi:hypothetical protein